MDEEEVHSTHARESCAHLHHDLLLVSVLLRLSSDLDSAARASRSLIVLKWAL